jgi:hypothetical protein
MVQTQEGFSLMLQTWRQWFNAIGLIFGMVGVVLLFFGDRRSRPLNKVFQSGWKTPPLYQAGKRSLNTTRL